MEGRNLAEKVSLYEQWVCTTYQELVRFGSSGNNTSGRATHKVVGAMSSFNCQMTWAIRNSFTS